MPETLLPAVSIPVLDHARLRRVALQAMQDRHPVAEPLLAELHRATICAQDSPNVVALDRYVMCRPDLGWPCERRVLVCPEDYRDPAMHLSVLSPLGAALLGLKVGARFPYRSIEGVFHIAIVEGVEGPDWSGPGPLAA